MKCNDAIEAFLDDLALRLRGDGAHARRILREVEEHLLDDVERLIGSLVQGFREIRHVVWPSRILARRPHSPWNSIP